MILQIRGAGNKECNIENGLVTVFISGSTGAVTTIESGPGLRDDFPDMLLRVAPREYTI